MTCWARMRQPPIRLITPKGPINSLLKHPTNLKVSVEGVGELCSITGSIINLKRHKLIPKH